MTNTLLRSFEVRIYQQEFRLLDFSWFMWHNWHMDRKGERRISRRSLEGTRTLAVGALQNGMHPEDVADLYDVGRSTVYNWWKEYRKRGPLR